PPVTHGGRGVGRKLAHAGYGHRQLDERANQLSVDLLGPLCRCGACSIEEEGPVDFMFTRHGAEPEKVGKEPHGLGLGVELITVANLAMSVTIGGVGKLEWNESAMR